MESSVRGSKQLLKLSTLVVFFTILCAGGNVVYGGKCDKDWATFYACYGGNRRSLPDDASVPRADISEWKKYMDYLTLLKREALSTGIGRDGHVGTVEQRGHSDAGSALADDDSFGERPEFGAVSGTLEASRIDGSYQDPKSGEPVDGQRGWSRGQAPWLPWQRSDAASGWRRSRKANDVALDSAVRKVGELVARRQLLDKWLNDVKDRLARKVQHR